MMWIRMIIILSVALTVSCSGDRSGRPAGVVNIPNTASGEADEQSLPRFEFARTIHDFGKVIQGEKVAFVFKFRNTGGGDLLISSISSTCGCTATEYPKTPVKPGEESTIRVTFDSSGRQGFQSKDITISANTQPRTTTLTVKAQVFLPEKRK